MPRSLWIIATCLGLLWNFGGFSANIHAQDSPPEGTIAFQSNRDGNNEIYIIDSDGENVTRLTNNGVDDNSPSWSPDGEWIAYESIQDDGNAQLFIIRADGSDIRQLTDNRYSDVRPYWGN